MPDASTDTISVKLNWEGPFTFGPSATLGCVFDQPITEEVGGIYLWTIPFEDGFLINYVGETSKQKICDRLSQGVRYILSGQDIWGDLDAFEKGIRRVVERPIQLKKFLGEYERRSQEIIRLLRGYRVFVSPFPQSQWTTKQVEAFLIHTLKTQCKEIKDFLYNKEIQPPPYLKVSCKTSCKLRGLQSIII